MTEPRSEPRTESSSEPGPDGDVGGARATDGRAGDTPERQGRRRAPRDVGDRVILYLARGVFVLVSAGIGLYTWLYFRDQAVRQSVDAPDPVPVILGFCAVAVVLIAAEILLSSRTSIRILSAVAFGLIIGLGLSLVFQPVAELILGVVVGELAGSERESVTRLIRLISTTVFSYFGICVLLQTRDDFKFVIPYVEFRRDVKGHVPLLIDTSTIIDGRIGALIETGILDQKIFVPRFVLDELQGVADSVDRSRRERGRRGMDILEEMRRRHGVEILERGPPRGADVDRELLALAEELGAKLVTNDFNLQKRARLQGVSVINLNDLAAALKTVAVPGEEIRVRLLREGEESGQAVGFLADGTMVVVENADRKIGAEVTISVTSSTQTSAGKMIFGRLRRSGSNHRRSRRDRRSRGGESRESVSTNVE